MTARTPLRAAALEALRPCRHDTTVGVGFASPASAPGRLRTLLGSCVAVTWWHPLLKVGYMAHVVSPRRHPEAGDVNRPRDWFVTDALPRAIRWAAMLDPNPHAWHVKVFGGGRQFPIAAHHHLTWDVPSQNLAEVRRILRAADHEPIAWHVGGTGPRLVVVDLATGNVWLSHTPKAEVGSIDPPLRIGRRRSSAN